MTLLFSDIIKYREPHELFYDVDVEEEEENVEGNVHYFQILQPPKLDIKIHSISRFLYVSKILYKYLVREDEWQLIRHYKPNEYLMYISLTFNDEDYLRNLEEDIYQYLVDKGVVIPFPHKNLDYIITKDDNCEDYLTYIEFPPAQCDYLELNINVKSILNNIFTNGSPFCEFIGYSKILCKNFQYNLPTCIF